MSNRRAVKRKADVTKGVTPGKARSSGSWRPNLRLILVFAVIGAVVSLLMILRFSENPDASLRAGNANDTGGVTTVPKTPARPPDPLDTSASTAPVTAEPVPGPADTRETGGEAAMPGPAPPQQNAAEPPPPEAPAVAGNPAAEAPDAPEPSQSAASEPAAPPLPVPAPGQGQGSAQDETPGSAGAPLPWQPDRAGPATSQQPEIASLPPESSPGRDIELPSRSELRGWLKSEAREFVGGVDEDGLPLYRFDIWLEAPEETRSQLRQVKYEYLAPSVQPPVQSSTDPKDGFRVKFGAASCAEKATVTLVMKDSRERTVTVNGCRILN